MNCFVWRVPYATDRFTNSTSKFEFIRNELLGKKILRQGWGIEDLRKGESSYVKEWIRIGWVDSAAAKKRFNILKPMLDIKFGDFIVIPRLSLRNNQNTSGKYFTIVFCTKDYNFSFPPSIPDKDFGNFIEVDWSEENFTYDYDKLSPNKSLKYISDHLSSYSKAINRVLDTNFTKAVLKL